MRRANYHETFANAALTAILAVVADIPCGRVATYGQVARLAGLPGRARLVGRALADAPPEAAGIPWHRVINAQGRISLTATSPAGREQRRRLKNEGIVFLKGRVDLRRYGWHAGNDSPLLD